MKRFAILLGAALSALQALAMRVQNLTDEGAGLRREVDRLNAIIAANPGGNPNPPATDPDQPQAEQAANLVETWLDDNGFTVTQPVDPTAPTLPIGGVVQDPTLAVEVGGGDPATQAQEVPEGGHAPFQR